MEQKYPKIDPEIKEKWLEDLRSGKYTQGRSALERVFPDFDGGEVVVHCCLGVLMEQLIPKMGIVKTRKASGYAIYTCPSGVGATVYLAPEALDFVGLAHDAEGHLADLNDCGIPFAEIADWIEESL